MFSSLPSLNGLLNEETMVKLKSGTLSKEELVESLMGSTPLKQISKKVDIRWENPVIPRYNGQRSQSVQCSPAPGIETEKAWQSIAPLIEQIVLPEGYSLEWQGEKAANNQSMEYLFRNFPFRHHPHDYHPDYVIQRLPETAYHLLLSAFHISRCRSGHAHNWKDLQLCCHRRYLGTYRYAY